MDVRGVLCMKGGDGNESYARNSSLQKGAMLKAKPIVEESLTELYNSTSPECLVMADLGCGSGPNTLILVGEVIDIIRQNCRRLKTKPPIFQAFLNDLPANDFNSILNSLPSFYEKLERENGNELDQCFVSATAGSFYGRLFPPKSLHFVHSCYSLQWRSKVPEGLVTETGMALNKGNICVGKSSCQKVVGLYSDLFKEDLWSFLRARSAEMVEAGAMVLTFLGRQNETIPSSSNQCFNIYGLLVNCLQEMVVEGEIGEAEVESCSIPFYDATPAEVQEVVEEEGSFRIRRLETFTLNWDPRGSSNCHRHRSRGNYVSAYMRAANESVLAPHFGPQILDSLFRRFALKVEEYEDIGTGEFTNITVSLTKS